MRFARLPLPIIAFGLLLSGRPLLRADAIDDFCRKLPRSVHQGKLSELDAIAQFDDLRLARTLFPLIGDRKVSGIARDRIADGVAKWSNGKARQELVSLWKQQLTRQPSDGHFLFFARLALPETERIFQAAVVALNAKDGMKDPVHAGIVIRGLAGFPTQPDGGVKLLGRLLDPAQPHVVRASAAETLGCIANASAVPVLVPYVVDDAIGDMVLASLFRLTQQDHGPDTEAWRKWLASVEGSIELKMLSLKDWTDYIEAKRLVAAEKGEPPPDMTSFYGMEFKARAALFVLDTSGSMSGERIKRLKAQMSNLVLAMERCRTVPRFGILTFDDEVRSCFPGKGLSDKGEISFRKASKFVDSMTADGGTAMLGALRYAREKIAPDGNLDAIYLLSDGAPGDGTSNMVLDEARTLYERHRVRIHTIEILEPRPAALPPPAVAMPSLLEEIATLTGGHYLKP